MSTSEFVAAEFSASATLLEKMKIDLADQIAHVGELMAEQATSGRKVLIFGNGGSAADAQHFAAELAGRYRVERPGVPALALTTNTSALTAIANDYAYTDIFARQVHALAEKGDVVIGISTSGGSPNVIAGLQAARECGAISVALIGAHTDEASPVADEVISIPSTDTPRIQEAHGVIIHILSDIVEQALVQPEEMNARG